MGISEKQKGVFLMLLSSLFFSAMQIAVAYSGGRIPVMEQVVKEMFHGKYAARKSIQTEFADPGNLLFQVDAIAYSGK